MLSVLFESASHMYFFTKIRFVIYNTNFCKEIWEALSKSTKTMKELAFGGLEGPITLFYVFLYINSHRKAMKLDVGLCDIRKVQGFEIKIGARCA